MKVCICIISKMVMFGSRLEMVHFKSVFSVVCDVRVRIWANGYKLRLAGIMLVGDL